MSGLKIGLVSPASDESVQLAELLVEHGAEVTHNLTPEKIADEHLSDETIHVWLLSVDDDSWDDSVDHLLDESDIPVYFNEPGTLTKQAHPQFWCKNLISRLFEITGLAPEAETESEPEQSEASASPIKEDSISSVSPEPPIAAEASSGESPALELEAETPLSQSLDDLEVSTQDLPQDIAAELVSELESISPVLNEELATEEAEPESLDEIPLSDFELSSETSDDNSEELTLESESSNDQFEEDADVELEGFTLVLDEEIDIDTPETESPEDTRSDLEFSETLTIEPSDLTEESASTEEPVESQSFEVSVNEVISPDLSEQDSEEEQIHEDELGFELELDSELDDLSLEPESGELQEPLAGAELSLEADDLEDPNILIEEPISFEEPLGVEEQIVEDQSMELQSSDDELELVLDDGDLGQQPEIELPEPELNLEEPSELNTGGLELESLESEESLDTHTGKAHFSIDDSGKLPSEEVVQTVESAEVEDEEDNLGGLTLEAMEGEQSSPTGRANFLEEEPSLQQEQANDNLDDDSSLELEIEQDNTGGLELESIEDESQPDWLNTGANQDVLAIEQPSENIELTELEDVQKETADAELDFDLSLEPSEDDETADEFLLDIEQSDEIEEQAFRNENGLDQESVAEPALEVSHQEVLDAEISSGIEFDEDTIKDIAREALTDDGIDSLDENNSSGSFEADYELDAMVDIQRIDDQAADSVEPLEELSETISETTSETEPSEELNAQELAFDTPEVQEDILPSEDLTAEASLEELIVPEPEPEPEPEPIVEDDSLSDGFVVDPVEEPTGPELDFSAEEEVETFEIPMLDETAVDIEFEEKVEPTFETRFTPCWVIGASLGGPAAVKRFLNAVPADINASFVIAQHIDENFLPVLAEILTNSSQFTVTVAQGSNDIEPGKVYLAPLKGKLVVLQDGSMLVDHSQKWSAPYSPCINDVIEAVSSVYGDLSGAIIFSGMGEDGLNGARKMRQAGGQVWAQSTDTCANPSMPESVINNGETDFVGTPEQLADRLVAELKGSVTMAG